MGNQAEGQLMIPQAHQRLADWDDAIAEGAQIHRSCHLDRDERNRDHYRRGRPWLASFYFRGISDMAVEREVLDWGVRLTARLFTGANASLVIKSEIAVYKPGKGSEVRITFPVRP